jgi:hypothetical protein
MIDKVIEIPPTVGKLNNVIFLGRNGITKKSLSFPTVIIEATI